MGHEAHRLSLLWTFPLREIQCMPDSLAQAQFLSENLNLVMVYIKSGY